MSQSKDQIEQDAIAAEWGLALDPDAATALAAAPTAGGAGPGVEHDGRAMVRGAGRGFQVLATTAARAAPSAS